MRAHPGIFHCSYESDRLPWRRVRTPALKVERSSVIRKSREAVAVLMNLQRSQYIQAAAWRAGRRVIIRPRTYCLYDVFWRDHFAISMPMEKFFPLDGRFATASTAWTGLAAAQPAR